MSAEAGKNEAEGTANSGIAGAAICPVCKSHRGSLVFRKKTTRVFDIVRCRGCGLVYAWPTPSAQELRRFYESDYFVGSDKQTGYDNYWGHGEDNMLRMWKELHAYAKLERLEQAGERSVLDVGCASGGFLHSAAQAGWTTKGVEFASDAVQRARELYHLDVEPGDVFSPSLDGRRFGLITFWHVLEHIPNPVAALVRAKSLLAPGGLLFVELPNWNSLGRLVRKSDWSQLLPPAHLNYFTRRSLARAARLQVGMKVERCTTHYVKGFDVLASRPYPSIVKAALSGVHTAVCAMGCGGYLRLLARQSD